MRRALFVLWYPQVMYIHNYPRRHCLIGSLSAVVTLAGCTLFVCRRRLCGGTCMHRPSGCQTTRKTMKSIYRKIISRHSWAIYGHIRCLQEYKWCQMTLGLDNTVPTGRFGIPVVSLLPCESRFNQSLLIQDFPQWAVDRTTSLPGESTTQRLNGGSGDALKREFLRHGLLGHMDRNETKDIRWAFDYWQFP